ncbi:hypothetical protein MNEG_4516, partial [Monoraphidium neglectum]
APRTPLALPITRRPPPAHPAQCTPLLPQSPRSSMTCGASSPPCCWRNQSWARRAAPAGAAAAAAAAAALQQRARRLQTDG